MQLINRVGRFKGRILSKAVGETQKSQLPQAVLQLLATEWYDRSTKTWYDYSAQEQCITGYLVLFGKDGNATLNCKQVMKVLGWDGRSLAGLDALDVSALELQFEVGQNNYPDAACPVQVDWIDTADAEPERGLSKMDSAALKDLDAKYAHALAKNAEPKKAVAVPAVPAVPGGSVAKPTGVPVPPPISAPAPAPAPEAPKRGRKPKPAPEPSPLPSGPQPFDLDPDPASDELPDVNENLTPDVPAVPAPVTSEVWDELKAWNAVCKGKFTQTTQKELEAAWMKWFGENKKSKTEMTSDDWFRLKNYVLTDCNLGL